MVENVWLAEWDGSLWHRENDALVPGDPKKGAKGFVGALVPAADLHAHTFKLPKTTASDRFATQVEITMYEESGLDVEKEYAIAYVRHALEFEDSWLVEAYAVETARLKELFGPSVKKLHHIDLMVPPYLVYEGFYASSDGGERGTDLFLHLGERESFAVLCKGGRYIAHRNLPPLEAVALKAQVTPAVLRETLAKQGLDKGAYAPDESMVMVAISDALGAMVERIVQTVNHKRGLFGFASVDTVYLDFEGGEIPGLWALLDGYGFSESDKRLFACCGLSKAWAYRAAACRYFEAVASGEIAETANLTVFEKSPSLLATHVGKFLVLAAAALVTVVGAGAYLEWENANLQTREAALEAEYRSIVEKTKRLTRHLDSLKKKHRQLQKRNEESIRAVYAYDEAADAMELIVASKLKRRRMIEDVDRALAAEKLSAISIDQNGSKKIAVEILTPYKERDRIARFMGRMIDKGYAGVETERILLNKDVYKSRVEIVR